MVDFKIVEVFTGEVLKVYDVKLSGDKTLFLVWKGYYWKWLDARKCELHEDGHYGG